MTVGWTGAHLQRCATVTATVSYDVPTIVVPWIGAFGDGPVSTSARHTEVVDPYRRGLEVDGFDPGACGG
jgi:hypothetical protein